jgi:hypothetical protein
VDYNVAAQRMDFNVLVILLLRENDKWRDVKEDTIKLSS